MAKQLFGTDGIRGVAGEYPLDDRTVFAVGRALAGHVGRLAGSPKVLIGRDTRASGPPLEELLAGGLEQGGVGAMSADVITTPGVAYLTEAGDFVAGIMISASHNSFEDNGIKVFSPSGQKLPDSEEHELERKIFDLLEGATRPSRKSLQPDTALAEAYLEHLLAVGSPDVNFRGLRIVADCANGAASDLAPAFFQRLGVAAEFLSNHPDGRNINRDCGSLHMQVLQRRVVEQGADLGVAFDGDADRALFVAENGEIADGDVILLLAAQHLSRRNHLPGNRIVTTVMANMGLEKSLADRGISLARTQVGDKYVLEEMIESGVALGGEQSGHIIFSEYATTGDGLLTARMMLEIVSASGRPLSELKRQLTVFPQRLENVRVSRKPPLEQVPALAEAIEQSEKALGSAGRVLVRYSGTEPLVRIMVEAEDDAMVEEHTGRLVKVFQARLGS